MQILRAFSPHAQRLERWIGPDLVETLSQKMRGFHGPDPIAISCVPGRVFVTNRGDFVGAIRGGHYAELAGFYADKIVRKWPQAARTQLATANMGFASLSDFVAEVTVNGKRQDFVIGKAGVTGVANVANSLWDVGPQPAAGAAATGTTAGHSPTSATTGAVPFVNPAGGDTTHFIGGAWQGTVANNLVLMYDRFYAANHNIATQSPAITGTPTRYQSTAARNTFVTVFVTTALGGTPGTYQVTYVDQDGNTAEAMTAQTLVAASIARRFPFANTVGNGWFLPFNAPDYGARALTQITQSVATGTGNVDVVIGKPLVWMPAAIANFAVYLDAILNPLNFVPIADNACLAFMEVNKGATTATTYNGMIALGQG